MASTTQSPPKNIDKDILIAAVEGGGTSFRVAICLVNHNGNHHDIPEILHRIDIDSSHDDPARTLQECAAFLKQHLPHDGYWALGIGMFGPVGVDIQKTEQYGRILPTTPKESWRNVDILTPLRAACQGTRKLAVQVETDVNAPALAEYLQETTNTNNKISKITSLAYVTVGTGVGVGLIVNGQPVHGRMHPEGGHVPVQPLASDKFTGYSWNSHSPFGGFHTVEGLASSVALTERLEQRQQLEQNPGQQQQPPGPGQPNQPPGQQPPGQRLSRSVLADVADDDEIWDHAANALANLSVTLLLTLSMEKIVFGGGIMKRPGLLEQIRKRTVTLLNGYLELPEDMSELITTSQFGQDAGLIGAIVLAQRAMVTTATNDKPTEETLAREKGMKQEAFNMGLIHGLLFGGVFTALLLPLFGKRRK
jgi:fructokinase